MQKMKTVISFFEKNGIYIIIISYILLLLVSIIDWLINNHLKYAIYTVYLGLISSLIFCIIKAVAEHHLFNIR